MVEHIERTFEQDHKRKPVRLLALQLQELQGQRAQITPEPLTLHSPRGPLLKHWCRN